MKVEVKPRYLSEIKADSGSDFEKGHPLYVTRQRKEALLSNPYIHDGGDVIFQWVGYVDGDVAGFNYSFPIHVWADGISYDATTGSMLNVADWARRSGLGLVLPAKGVEITSKDGIAIAAACSQMAIPVHKVNGYKYFLYPRYIVLWRSRCVIEKFMANWVAKFLSLFVDGGIWFYNKILSLVVALCLNRYDVEKVCADDAILLQKMADIVSSDGHRFREDHDAGWFKWHMKCSFSDDGPSEAYVLRAKDTHDVVAFAMTKRRFYETASHRGFKNVWLGSIIEWGALSNAHQKLKWLIAKVALQLSSTCDAVDFSVADEKLKRFATHIGWRQVGEANVGIKTMPKFPLFKDPAIFDVCNWRIRPAMGDNGLS